MNKAVHDLPVADDDIKMNRKDYLETFNIALSKHIDITIIDKLDFAPGLNTTEKRSILVKREGFWQTQLRTMNHYGGLNIKDERKLYNSRKAGELANKRAPPVSSTIDKSQSPANHTTTTLADNMPPTLDTHPTHVIRALLPTQHPPSTTHTEEPPTIRRSSRIAQLKTKIV